MKHESDESPKEGSQIRAYYQRGVMYAAEAMLLTIRPSKKKVERLYDADEMSDYKNLAIEHLRVALSHTGTCEEQCIKIKTALLLAKLSQGMPEAVEGYFYQAVEIARRYLGEDFSATEEGVEIVKSYLTNIDPSFQRLFIDTHIASFLPLLKLIIGAESEKRNRKKIKALQDIGSDSTNSSSYEEILDALRIGIGPFRLSILSEESGSYIVHHCGHGQDEEGGREMIGFSEPIFVYVFDRPRKYFIHIDRGSSEQENQFSRAELHDTIYPMLEKYIQKKEHAFFVSVMDNIGFIDAAESQVKPSQETNDYRSFISHVVNHPGIPGSHHSNEAFVESCARAIDICRIVTLSYKQGDMYSSKNVLEEIERVLQGRVERKVLHRVSSLLLSRNETMDGTGYPYGLGRGNIPIEGRIYSIVRAYEALREMHGGDHRKILGTMNEWAEGGYFDRHILTLFCQFFTDTRTIRTYERSTDSEYVLTPRRKNQYEVYRSQWKKLIDTMRKIEDKYDEVRQSEGKKEKQNALFLDINKLQLQLRREANVRKIILLTRHGETESDTPMGPPGDDDEMLTDSGEQSSREKGELLAGLQISLYTSPLLRAEQTAKIICQKVRRCTELCLSCPHIAREETLRNPIKFKDNGRYNSYAQKILVDTTGSLMDFLIRATSSSNEDMRLFITHRDLGRHMIFWLQNLFFAEGIVGDKNPFGNEMIYEFLFRGDHLISGSAEGGAGLLFSVHGWKEILEDIVDIAEEVFKERFVPSSFLRVDLIELHDEFLDYLDRQIENDDSKMKEFFSRLGQTPRAAHCVEILRSEGFFA